MLAYFPALVTYITLVHIVPSQVFKGFNLVAACAQHFAHNIQYPVFNRCDLHINIILCELI